MRRLGPDLRLAGLTYALLHGKAVVLLLAHRQGRRSGKWDDLGARFATGRTSGNADLRLDRWQSRRDLGTAGLDPVLRVHIRSPDRPGATLDVLDSLRETLQAAAPVSLQPGDWNVWHASTVVTAGNAALIRLTVRLSADPRMVGHWGPAEFEEIERKVRALAARKAAAAGNSAGSPGERLGAPEDTVISVRLITVPNPDP